MKFHRILDRAPLPLNRDEKVWIAWCVKVFDEIVDCFSILQKNSVFADALCSTSMAVIYQIPGRTFGKVIDKITVYDILYKSVDTLGLKTCLVLYKMNPGNGIYKEAIHELFLLGLARRDTTAGSWARALNIDPRPLELWVLLGLPISVEYERTIKEWINLQYPWPISQEVHFYLKQVFSLNTSNKQENIDES